MEQPSITAVISKSDSINNSETGIQNISSEYQEVKKLIKSPSLILAEFFLLSNIILLITIIFTIINSLFLFCTYSGGIGGGVSCPPAFFWYEIPANVLFLVPVFIFLSLFLALIPAGVPVIIYIFAFKLLRKKTLEITSSNGSETELKILNILRLSLITFPFLLLIGVLTINIFAGNF